MDIAGLLIQALVCLSGFDLLAGVHDLLIILLILPSKVCGKKVEIRFVKNVLQFLTKRPTEVLIGKGEAPLQILTDDVLGKAFDKIVIKRL